ncbi:MAG: ketopantoate reductase [Myxococcota bacterium]|jgi:ketopantoate reductase
MNVLLIGAGAVGQVYGRHLQRGGADVSFFVREKYADACRAGLVVYPLNESRSRKPIEFTGFGVVTTVEEVAASTWDQVWLCVSATALEGDWLAPLLGAIGSATLVSLQPGLEVKGRLAKHVPEAQIVMGMIGFISWQAPLPRTEADGPDPKPVPTPGMVYWFPPMSPSPFSGPDARVDPLVAALKRGDCPTRKTSDAAGAAAGPTALMMSILTALELESWSFSQLLKSDSVQLAADAAHEALDVVGSQLNNKQRMIKFAARPWIIRLILRLGPRVVPFDLEVYIRYHFTKVGDQTQMLIDSYIEDGAASALPVTTLTTLRNKAWPEQLSDSR